MHSLSVCFVLFIASCLIIGDALAFNVASVNNLFKRSNVNESICCLPSVCSVQGIQNQYNLVQPSNNNNIFHYKASISYNADYNQGKSRMNYAYTFAGQNFNLTTWNFKVDSATTVTYRSDGVTCKCHKSLDVNEWKPVCIPRLANSQITKGKLGFYDAINVINKNSEYEFQVWVFREPHMPADKCWTLANTEIFPQNVVDTQYFSMVEKVDFNLFKIPPICIPIEECL